MIANFETQIPTGNFAIKSTGYDPERALRGAWESCNKLRNVDEVISSTFLKQIGGIYGKTIACGVPWRILSCK